MGDFYEATDKMAAKKSKKTEEPKAVTQPKFPYTNKPATLRKVLKLIPSKPKPDKVNQTLLQSWGFKDNNDRSVLRVLKAVRLITENNEPTDLYTVYMQLNGGSKALGPEIKRVYAPLFAAEHKPYSESNEKLQNLFNIHSGGGDATLDFQIATFKALCENASFDDLPASAGATNATTNSGTNTSNEGQVNTGSGPAVNINLHIHLPENKSRREYTDIIEDIGRYIFGRTVEKRD